MLDFWKEKVEAAVSDLFDLSISADVSIPDEQFGDVATNVAMKVAGQLKQNPREVAEKLINSLKELPEIAEATVAGPGFVNARFTDEFLVSHVNLDHPQTLKGQKIVAEYSDPNPFKVLHAGHLYTSIVGSALSNLYALHGADVARVNFGGDVGLHVAKAMWGIIQELGGEHVEKLNDVPENERADWLSKRYVEGNTAYESDEQAKQQIVAYNQAVYRLYEQDDHESDFAKLYRTCRQWSYDYFDAFYDRIGTPFDKYFPESITAPVGLKTVQRELENGVYEESDGAVIFDGEKYDLHKRVFINSKGLPTYEAKDVGLLMLKWQEYAYDQSLIITGSDIIEYMKVVLKSIEQFEPEAVQRTKHITHGMVKLKGGVKMSSRLGNFLKAEDILDMTTHAIGENGTEPTVLAAVKYAFLKQSVGQDIWFDPDESIATHGNSGPYLQYAHARACSILSKAGKEKIELTATDFDAAERTMVRKMAEYRVVIAQAMVTLSPHDICTYLYELAQEFNRFYESNKVIGDAREDTRLQLVSQYAKTLADGLKILGIEAPEKM